MQPAVPLVHLQSEPSAPPPAFAAPPRTHFRVRQAALATSALAALHDAADRCQALAVPDPTVASRSSEPLATALLRACGAAHPNGGAMPRAEIYIRRQHPIHRETAAGTAAPVMPTAAAPPTQHPHSEAPAQRPTNPPAPHTAATSPARQDPMHREPKPAAQPRPTAAPPPSSRNPQQNPMHREAAPGTGPLRNGNPRGNPNAAPRCGAKTRTGCPCRSPAIRGKRRCRMHGGASTGPRTQEGLARLRSARTTHGGYTGELRIKSRYHTTLLRRSRTWIAALLLEDDLPPAAQARLQAWPPELAMPLYPSLDRQPSRAEEHAFVQQEARALAPWKQALAFARACRRAESPPAAVAEELARAFARLPPPPPRPADATPWQNDFRRRPPRARARPSSQPPAAPTQ